MIFKKIRLLLGIWLILTIPSIFLFANKYKINLDDQDLLNNNVFFNENNSSSFTDVKLDSLNLFIPLNFHGLLQSNSLINNVISKREINLIEYHSTFELLSDKTNSFPFYLGAAGLMNKLCFFGMKIPKVSYQYNGRILSDFEFASYNLEEISSEFFENAEILFGTYSVIQSENSVGVSINFQEIINNTNKPYTKLWYAQNSNDMISLDGIYSQNFLPNTNFSFGFRRQFAFGYYDNSKVDNWNVRTKFRWNLSENTNISLTENFNHIRNGINEGLNLARTQNINYFDRDAAVVNFINFSYENFSHDITLSLTYNINDDTTSNIKANIFYSSDDKNYKFDDTQFFLINDSLLRQNYFSNYFGTDIRFYTKILNYLSIKSGAEFVKISSDSSNVKFSPSINSSSLSLFILSEFYPINNFILYSGVRYKNYLSKNNINWGLGISYKNNKFGTIVLDYSQSYYYHPFLINNQIDEYHQLLFLDYKIQTLDNLYSFGVYNHNIIVNNKNNIQESNFYLPENESLIGAYFSANINPWNELYLKSKILYNTNLKENKKDYLPKIYLSLASYYRFYVGKSMMNLGFELKLMSKMNCFPYSRQFLFKIPDNEDIDFYDNFMFNGLTFFAIAKLGDAFVKASFENIFGADYYFVPVYPNFKYNIRFSFVWSFFN